MCFLFRFCGTVVFFIHFVVVFVFIVDLCLCGCLLCALFFPLYRNTIIRFFSRPIHLNEPNEFYAILLGVGCLKCNIPNALLCSQRGGKKRCGLEWFIEVHGVFMHSGA